MRARHAATAVSVRALVVFLCVAFLCCAQLVWWVVFHLREGEERSLRLQDDLARSAALAVHGLEHVAPDARALTLRERDPRLVLVPAAGAPGAPRVDGEAVVPRPEVLSAARDEAHRRSVMFLSESGFFLVLVLMGVGLVYEALRREVRLRAQKDLFIGAVTHELKTPLTALRLQAQTLAVRALGQEQVRTYAERMQQDVDRLARLVEQLLQAAHMGAGKLMLSMQPLDLGARLRLLVEELAPKLAHDGLELRAELAEGLWVRADWDVLRGVFGGLVDNAVKYRGSGTLILVRAHRQGAVVRVEVEDRGLGIPAAERRLIFDRFYRIDDERAREVPGTGLGLYLAQEIVRAHRGRIDVGPALGGVGSVFWVELPAQAPS